METNLKQFIVIIQARTASTRLPNKVLAKIGEKTLIQLLIERVKSCKLIDEIVLATTKDTSDDYLAEHVKNLGIRVTRGSSENVLSRFCLAAKKSPASNYIRITGDCPLIDPLLISKTLEFYLSSNFDYVSNCYPPTYADGLDVEVFSKDCLFNANLLSNSKFEKEHVTPWIRNNKNLKIGCLKNSFDFSNSRWTVDEKEDLNLVELIFKHFNNKINFSWEEILEFEKNNPELFSINKKYKRNEGSLIPTGEKYWRRAKKVIPGGSMLLSKRSEIFLPGKWPAYFSKTKGCHVWDLDNNKYIDISLMGVGTNLLGYSNSRVDEAVKETINKGNLSTLNCPEEVLLAEKLIEINPWADMARFARTGGEANAIAIRIARAATGKDKIAICGYHGWHDWYLATNLENKKALNTHLLPGLNPIGVPKDLKNSVIPFKYNSIDEFKEIVETNDLAAIKMEVERSEPPLNDFLIEIRRICTKKNIILIFDECSSGFRETYGGLHKKYNVNPDMAIFGKTLGNGYAITAVIGIRAIMEYAQETFISSTFWTERIGPTAALQTLKVMSEIKSWEYVTSLGKYLKKVWLDLAKRNNLNLEINGIYPLISFRIKSDNYLKYKTYITQEMLKHGYLASTTCYLSIAHNKKIIDEYSFHLNKIFKEISECENGKNINQLLETEVSHSTFQRLN